MNHQRTKGPRTGLNPSQQAALVKLLGDDDEAVVQSIRDTIFSYGSGAQSWLEPYLLDNDPQVRNRVRQVVHELGRNAADTEFLSFCVSSGEDLDIEHGEWLLAKTRHPEINTAGYQAVIDSFAADLQIEIDSTSGPEGILATINKYLFERQGFCGNEVEYYDPENSYLNSVIDRRTGNPVSLCLIYLFVARRLKLPAVGIGMPGHFLLRFQFSTGAVFVDAFNGGRILSKADCVKHLTDSNHGFLEAYLAPISPRRTLLRICSNLHHIYKELDDDIEAIRLQGYLIALAK